MQQVLVALFCVSLWITAHGVQLMRNSMATDPEDPEGICTLPARMVFKDTQVSENSLGQVSDISPWKPSSIRFNNVFPHSDMNVDLVVSAVTTYFGSKNGNKAFGEYAVINLNAGAVVSLKFGFVDRVTGVPVVVNPFYFTVSNLGRFDDQQGGSKSFKAEGFVSYHVSDDTNITVESIGDTKMLFSSNFVGLRGDHGQRPPEISASMSPAAAANSVTLEYPALSQFDLVLNVSQGVGDRDFYFGGVSNLVCTERALCKSFTCPEYYNKKTGAANDACASSRCSELVDVSTCCEPVTPNRCDTGTMISFSEQSLVYANLGGFNDTSPSGIRFHDIFADTKNPIDLVVKNTSVYQMNTASTLVDNYLMIDIESDTSVALLFEFVDSKGKETSIPFPFTLGVFDLDMQKDGAAIEQVEVDGYDSYRLSENTTIKTMDEGASAVFTATIPGTRADNPRDPLNQTQEQLDKTVSFKFGKKVSHFSMKARVSGGGGGRRLQLSGWCENICPALGSFCTEVNCPVGYTHHPDENRRCAGEMCTESDFDNCCVPFPHGVCSPQKRLEIVPDSLVHNNLGGVGPDVKLPNSMRIVDVFPQSKTFVELRVSVNGHYQVPFPDGSDNQPHNMLYGGFLRIDVHAGSVLSLNLEFFDMESKIMAPGTFMLTIASLEKGAADTAVQSVTASGFEYFNVSSNSSLDITAKNDSRGFESTVFTGTAHAALTKDVSGSSLHMTSKDLDRAVAIMYSGKVAANLDLAVSPGAGYRSFLIGGASRLGCPAELALCNTMLCPKTHRLRETAGALSCAGTECTSEDLDTCCQIVSKQVCDPSASLSLENVVISNLGGTGPDKGTPKLIFGDVFPNSPDYVDLEITNTTPYVPFDSRDNGIHNGFGAISVSPNSATSFEFRLVDRRTNKPLAHIGEYAFSLVHLQAELNHITGVLDGQPSLAVPSAMEYSLSDRSFIRSYVGNNFTATPYSDGSPAPLHPWQLAVRHLRNTVVMKMNRSVFDVNTQIGDGHSTQRRVLFTGPTNLACPVRAYCNSHTCPQDMVLIGSANSTVCAGSVCTDLDTGRCCRYEECDEERTLDLSNMIVNNLNGQGPMKVPDGMKHGKTIMYGNVFPLSGANMNLVLSVKPETEYFPYDVQRNGLDNGYGIVNIRSGSEVDLTFTFVDANTLEPRAVPRFFITFSGIDQSERDTVESLTVYKAVVHSYRGHGAGSYAKNRRRRSRGVIS